VSPELLHHELDVPPLDIPQRHDRRGHWPRGPAWKMLLVGAAAVAGACLIATSAGRYLAAAGPRLVKAPVVRSRVLRSGRAVA
jgi:hypothetical protein